MTYPSIYPTGTTIYDPDRCWNGYTIFQAKELGALLIDMNGREVRLWKGFHGFPNKLFPDGHVLGKAFYLLSEFPGRYAGGTVWVEARENDEAGDAPSRHDGVSPVIIGSNDWAAAWAKDENGQAMVATTPGGERQREMAYRFGVNLIMYTLSGNYKADQVHVPEILERLGQ